MAVANNARPVSLAEEEHYQSRSLTQDALARLFRNRMAVVALVMVTLLVVVAISADMMAGWGWIESYARQHRGSSLAEPLQCSIDVDANGDGVPDRSSSASCSGRTAWAAIFSAGRVYGARISLLVGVVGATVSLTIAWCTA
jgi:ABC-type dipeptide/oligopeptide/nickel transport system permease subunit